MGLWGDMSKDIHIAKIKLANMARDIGRAMFDEDMGSITVKKARRRKRQASQLPCIKYL